MGKYMYPFTDVSFKVLFGRPVCKVLLIEFLNDLFGKERHIRDLTFKNKEIQPEQQDGRTVIFDVLCEEDDGSLFIVEMQNVPQKYFLERGIYYGCRMIDDQGRRGDGWKYDLCPVCGIYFLNFLMPPLEKLCTDILLCDRDTGRVMSDKFHQVYLTLTWKQTNAGLILNVGFIY